jgi:hypothetical protein
LFDISNATLAWRHRCRKKTAKASLFVAAFAITLWAVHLPQQLQATRLTTSEPSLQIAMGNAESSPSGAGEKDAFVNFPGSALVDALNCGGLDDTDTSPRINKANGTPHKTLSQFFSRMNTDDFCTMSPVNSDIGANTQFDEEYEEFRPRNTMDEMDSDYNSKQQLSMSQSQQSPHPLQIPSPNTKQKISSQLFAKAMVSEVTTNPNTMTPAAMAEREKRLLKAQEKARQFHNGGNNTGPRPVGAPGGVGQPSVLGSIAHVLKGNVDPGNDASPMKGGSETEPGSMTSDGHPGSSSILPPNSLSENRAAQEYSNNSVQTPRGGKYTVTIGLSLSRRSSLGHPDTVTRQTAFDFNELQDREYKYVSSTDASGWRAGGGERGGTAAENPSDEKHIVVGMSSNQPGTPNAQDNYKLSAPDTVHIPIIHIDAESPQAVDAIISALAAGEVFIPHMAIIPEALSVNGVSPPDLVVRFGTERNEDLPPDEWPNWCLEFMHNQLYEYFHGMGARWMKRPFSITLARKVRWKTVKHMNRYFAHAERVIDAWREKGPQYLDPQLAYIEGGATPEEVARPHGIYLLRNGVPTNYFAPNFDPPYTTKMTRSLLLNVLGKSWDKKRREWTSQPIPRLVTPSMLVTAMCGCGDSQAGGFVATEATLVDGSRGGNSTLLPEEAGIHSASPHGFNKKERKLSATQTPGPISESFGSNNSLHFNRRQSARDKTSTQSRRAEPPEEKLDNNIDIRHDLQMSNSHDLPKATSTHASNNAISASSATSSSKHGCPPTQEEGNTRSNRRSPKFNGVHLDQPQEEEKENSNCAMESGSSSVNHFAGSEIMQPSVAASNTTIPHTNMSPKTFSKSRDHHMLADEKKEDPMLSTMASDEDWLDEIVSKEETHVTFGSVL